MNRNEISNIFKSEMAQLKYELINDSSWNGVRLVEFQKGEAKVDLEFEGDTPGIWFKPPGSKKRYALWCLCQAYPDLKATEIEMTFENQLQILKTNLHFLMTEESAFSSFYEKFNNIDNLSTFFSDRKKANRSE